MIQLTVSPNSTKPLDYCNSCCCEQVDIKHMSSEQIVINYAPWCYPVAPRGISRTDIHVYLKSKHVEPTYEIVQQSTNIIEQPEMFWVNGSYEPLKSSYDYLFDIPSQNNVREDGLLYRDNFNKPEYFYSKASDWSDSKLYMANYVYSGLPQDIKPEYIRYSTTKYAHSLLQLDVSLTPFAYVGSVIGVYIKQWAENCECKSYTKDICIDLNVVNC